MKTNPRLRRFTHRPISDPLLQIVGDDLAPYFLSESDLSIDIEKWPINIHPLAFFEYNEDNIIEKINSLGWVKPKDTDPNSTNCPLNALANYLHKKRFSFHPYAWEIAGIVRSSCMKREEDLKKINEDGNMNMVKYGADLLDIKISS